MAQFNRGVEVCGGHILLPGQVPLMLRAYIHINKAALNITTTCPAVCIENKCHVSYVGMKCERSYATYHGTEKLNIFKINAIAVLSCAAEMWRMTRADEINGTFFREHAYEI